MAKVLITGITGFIGSNIAKVLISNGHSVIAIYREASNFKSCIDLHEMVTLVLSSDPLLVNKIKDFMPDVFINCAWMGVTNIDRNSWEVQFNNIPYLNTNLILCKVAGIKKFISLGSQAEYGYFDGAVDENASLKPVEVYGRAKIVASELVKQFCECHNISWYWLRLFSFFGPNESSNWLIPSLVKKMLTTSTVDMTKGEQKYAYLYVGDLGYALHQMLIREGQTGVYNISGSQVISIREIAEKVRTVVNPNFQINFGTIPYRHGQPMRMQGSTNKFVNEFGHFERTDIHSALVETVRSLVYNSK